MSFQNLAHREPQAEQIERVDAIVEEELFVCGIAAVHSVELRPRSEVPTHITGRLRGITFERAWRYWRTDGDVPLLVAQALYEQQPYGRRDVRAGGDAGASPPNGHLTHRAADGKTVYLLVPGSADADLIERHRSGKLVGTGMHEPIGKMLNETHWAETQEQFDKLVAVSVVTHYDIDSIGGLKVFADAVRAM